MRLRRKDCRHPGSLPATWALAICCLWLSAPALARQKVPTPPAASPSSGSVQAAGQVPDVQMVVGPGTIGWQVALVYPRKVARADVDRDLEMLGQTTGYPPQKPRVETRRLERADPSKVGEAPVMTSVTFETKANLVDYPNGRVMVEAAVGALQRYDRIAVVFLIPGRFQWTGGTQFDSPGVHIDASIGEGALVFVANIRSRPIPEFRFPGAGEPVVAPRVSTSRPRASGFSLAIIIWSVAFAVGMAVFAVVRWRTRG